MLFVLLSTLLTPICILASWEAIEVRVKEYMIAFLVLETMMVGTFCALDFVAFYMFFEGVLIPMFLIIGMWGGPRRIYSAFKFFLYTFLGSVLMLVACSPCTSTPARPTSWKSRGTLPSIHCRRACNSGCGWPSLRPSRSRCRCGRCIPGCPMPMSRRRRPAR